MRPTLNVDRRMSLLLVTPARPVEASRERLRLTYVLQILQL